MVVDALVPCYNEAPRLDGVLQALSDCPLISKIIFVDGGSTDGSGQLAQKYAKVDLLELKDKGGKGQDVKAGLNKITTHAIFLCDADLKGLTSRHVEKMIRLYEKHPEGLVVGLTQKSRYHFIHWLRANLLPLISGMRVIGANDLKNVLAHPLSSDWGIEAYMNYYFIKNKKPIIKTMLAGVNDPHKPAKAGHGWRPHFWEAYNLIEKYVLIYGKQLPADLFNGLKSFIYPLPREDKTYYPTFAKTINGVKLNYAKVGDGPVLIFIHGWANNWEGWKPIVPFLKKDFGLYLLDLPGFGDSGNLPVYSVNSLAEYLLKFVSRLKSKPRALVALSMGTLVACETLKLYPGASERLILIGAPLKGGKTDLVAKTLRYSLWLIKNTRIGERALKKIVETRLAAYAVSKYVNMYRFNRFLVDAYGLIGKKKMRQEAFTQMGISGAAYNLKETLQNLETQTLLIYGREDKISSPEYARRELLPKNPKIDCVDIEQAGHVVPWEKPREVALAIKNFLSRDQF